MSTNADKLHADLLMAANSGKLESVKTLIAAGANVDIAESTQGLTPLHCAAARGHVPVAEALLAAKANVNIKAKNGWTPLHYAAVEGHKTVAELLLANQADLTAGDSFGNATPLHFATLEGRKELVELLLTHGANVNAKTSEDITPLFWASGRGHREVVEVLLANGADVNAKNTKGVTPQFHADIRGHKDVTELLRGHVPHIAAKSDAALTESAVLAWLAEMYPGINAMDKECLEKKDHDGNTPMHRASAVGRADVVKFLIAKGADVNANNHRWDYPLHLPTQFHGRTLDMSLIGCHASIIDLLIANGADPNAENASQNRPLHIAAFNGDMNLATLLVKNGADVNAENGHGCSALQIALGARLTMMGTHPTATELHGIMLLKESRKRMVEFLVKHGAKGSLEPQRW